MASHAAPRRRRSGRIRLLLSLGLLVGFGAVGTTAYWTDRAVVDSGNISSGTMDLQLQTPTDDTWRHVELGAGGQGTSTTDTALSIPNLTPGESRAFNFGARNVGNPNLTYTATVGRGGTWTYVGTPIRVRFSAGGTADNGTTNNLRTGTCDGTALGAGPVNVGTSATTVIPTRTLTGGGSTTTTGQSEQLCVVVSMDPAATNDNQGKTGTLQLVFTATQAQP